MVNESFKRLKEASGRVSNRIECLIAGLEAERRGIDLVIERIPHSNDMKTAFVFCEILVSDYKTVIEILNDIRVRFFRISLMQTSDDSLEIITVREGIQTDLGMLEKMRLPSIQHSPLYDSLKGIIMEVKTLSAIGWE